MKEFEFGKKLYNIRVEKGLSQKELAEKLNVTNKAVSKWENGNAMPTLSTLINLCELLDIEISDLIISKNKKEKSVHKIAITGGPCSGKSTALSWLQKEFTKKGYMVLFVPETASELIVGGVAPWTIDKMDNFESYILKLQIEKEKIFEESAKHIDNYDKILIVCDRGTIDCKAYMSEGEFKKSLKRLNTNEVELKDRYDAVFHLVTAAKGAEEFYTCDNNSARSETLEEAIDRDNATLNAWTGHSHFRVIDNSTDFEGKMHRLLSEISNFLGEPEPFEIERKYLIEYPNLDILNSLPNCEKVEIIQTYLKNNGEETRIRQRGKNGYYTYTKTIKKKVSDIKRIEVESRITKDEYLNLLLEADTERKQIRKDRYCLMENNKYFEIDIYPFWKDKAILEIELNNENDEIKFPKFIKVIEEVTGNEDYYNFNLAKK